jgi:cell division protein FtsW
MSRVTAFLDPWSDPKRAGYHTIQSLLALGSGGITGLGLGVSRQKFLYLPFPHTDSIYAVVGEELGLVGTLAVLGLFLLLGWRGLLVAKHAPELFGRLLAVGTTTVLVFQAFLNIAVVTSSVPFTGVTLPFFSAGGSSLVASLICAGMLLSVSRWTALAGASGGQQVGTRARSRVGRRNRGAHLPGAGRAPGAA